MKNENEVGEILIAGQSVFNGYVNEKNNVFTKINNEKYYHTGDLGYIKNGEINCIGRIDNQVKIHGNRIELDEIRNCINKIDKVIDSVVLYENELLAFIVKKGNITEKEIIEKIATSLPKYKLPKKIFFEDSIPIKSGGKINKQELLLLNKNKETNIIYAENELFKIVNEVKGGLSLSMNANLFELGLESFDIIVLVQKIINKYIDSNVEEEFVKEIFEKIDGITLDKIEKLIKKYGGDI